MRLPFNRSESDDERIHPLLCEGTRDKWRWAPPTVLTSTSPDLSAQSDFDQLRELLEMIKTLFE
jgi:hypothetical protein